MEHLKHKRKRKSGILFVCAQLYRYIKLRNKRFGRHGITSRFENKTRYSLMFISTIKNSALSAAIW